jgi:hypothetical protein
MIHICSWRDANDDVMQTEPAWLSAIRTDIGGVALETTGLVLCHSLILG